MTSIYINSLLNVLRLDILPFLQLIFAHLDK